MPQLFPNVKKILFCEHTIHSLATLGEQVMAPESFSIPAGALMQKEIAMPCPARYTGAA